MTNEAKANKLSAAQVAQHIARGRTDSAVTLPMSCNAEGLLWIVHCWLRGRLPPDDREFLEKAMRAYGQACVAEAGKAG
ncbi:MAG: hypothetical protein ABSC06_34275 [Rhodopila sp.]|jgi:hypothetical protein